MRSPRPAAVTPLPVAVVARIAGADLPAGADAVAVTGVSLDSRAVLPGDLYAALPGARAHGADFVGAAVASGACAVLTDPAGASRLGSVRLESDRPDVADTGSDGAAHGIPVLVVDDPRAVLGQVAAEVYGHPADDLRLVGITGTNGKTTTAYLVESGLRQLGVRTGLLGTVETRIGDRRVASARTTPEATDLHAILAVMREEGIEAVVMEVSSHALAQHRVDGARYEVAVFTNLSQDHLDFHADMADYFTAKAALFTPTRAGRGVVCLDDEWGRRLADRAEIPLLTLATHEPADWTLLPGVWPAFTLAGPDGASLALHCHLPGTFNVLNTATAALVLLELGFPARDVEAALAVEPVVPGRMELVPGGAQDPRCLVDYAHTPEAVDAALAALRPTTPGRLVVVLGAGGDRDRGKRLAMGAAAARWADDLVVTDDNPRSEDPAAIRAELLAGARSAQPPGGAGPGAGGRSLHTSTAGRAAHIARAVALARASGRPADNTVVVLGKGHETGQEIGGTVHPFDDRDALRAALADRPYRPEDPT